MLSFVLAKNFLWNMGTWYFNELIAKGQQSSGEKSLFWWNGEVNGVFKRPENKKRREKKRGLEFLQYLTEKKLTRQSHIIGAGQCVI